MNFGLIGTGRITDWVLKGARYEPRFRAEAICSRTMPRAHAFALSHDIPLCFSDLDQMLACQEIDAIYIGTPNHTHAELAIRCLSAGKHVLCEKPLGANPSEVERMIEASRKNGKVLMEAMISTLNPNFLAAQEKVRDLGPIRHCSASFCQYSSKIQLLKNAIETGDPSLLPASFDPLCAGGALMDVGIYTIYPLVALFGEPLSVKAQTIKVNVPTSEGLLPVDLQGCATLGYEGLTASIAYSKIVDSFAPTEICGEKGNISLDKVHICRSVTYTPHAAPTSGQGLGPVAQPLVSIPFENPYTCEFTEFIDLVEGRKSQTNNSLENSLITARVMDKIANPGCIFESEMQKATERK